MDGDTLKHSQFYILDLCVLKTSEANKVLILKYHCRNENCKAIMPALELKYLSILALLESEIKKEGKYKSKIIILCKYFPQSSF